MANAGRIGSTQPRGMLKPVGSLSLSHSLASRLDAHVAVLAQLWGDTAMLQAPASMHLSGMGADEEPAKHHQELWSVS